MGRRLYSRQSNGRFRRTEETALTRSGGHATIGVASLLMIRARLDDERQVRYIVAGPCGAVEYHALAADGDPLGIEFHSPRPWYTAEEPQRCDILEGSCYPTGSSLDADACHRDYKEAAGDEEVIWRWLERRCREWAEEG